MTTPALLPCPDPWMVSLDDRCMVTEVNFTHSCRRDMCDCGPEIIGEFETPELAAYVVELHNRTVYSPATKDAELCTICNASACRHIRAKGPASKDAELAALKKRIPLCPPCDIGENTECICDAELVPKKWLNEEAELAAAWERYARALINYELKESNITAYWDAIEEARAALIKLGVSL